MCMAADRARCTVKNICVWVKSQPAMGSFYRSQHELIFVLKNGKSPHRNNIQLGRFGRNRTNVWQYPGGSALAHSRDEGNLLALHPTPKPVAMIEDSILDCTARGDVVLDPFFGSGSTLIAAERAGRRCFGIELDPLYVDTAVRRWQARTGKIAIHASSGRRFDEVQAKSGEKHARQR
jgi:DNA modification methylase